VKEIHRRIRDLEKLLGTKRGLPPLVTIINGQPGPEEVERITQEALEQTGLPPLIISCTVPPEERHESTAEKTT